MPLVLFLLFCLLLIPVQADEKWEVDKARGPVVDVPIRVEEGTWMSLDLSPDGKTLVFDLLGDLYLMPSSGGQARNLTSGHAWDMQPRFSPDGSSVAFTSDRGGGDNLWVISVDGKNPRALTDEKFRLLNSPAWDPSGEYVAGRKHFTGTRSLGAGEIWLYSLGAKAGLQMVEKANEQKDLGEPAFSPDGRYLYYSQDVTDGENFEYNKDANGEIYVIKRLDRQTGDTVRLVTGPGGAVRPTPSPDGKTLAFVRRHLGKTGLYLYDLKTDAVRLLYDGLERDMQETWAIHGVYPTMAWTPDSKALYFWAQGKIWRQPVSGGAPAQIPFRVDDSRVLQQALRFPVEVAPEQFPVKALRWVQRSPDGNRVLFQALGYIWLSDSKGSKPRRLTTQTDHFEFYPSFSPDGASVVYTTFSDESLGSVRLATLDGQSRELVAPGHFLEPAVAPGGDWVVYRKTSGNDLLSPLYSQEPGIYRVRTSGGQPEKLCGGTHPHFGSNPDHLYFVSGRALHRLELSSRQQRTLYKGEEISDFLVAPDGKHLAFLQGFQVFKTPLVETGQTIDLSKDSKSYPVRRLSGEAGYFLHWSGNKVHWSLGPELHSESGLVADLGFEQPYDKPSGEIALIGGRVLTMEGDQVLENGVVVIRDNRIVAVGPAGQVKPPSSARVIDVSGKTVMPGLVDVHWHGSFGARQLMPQENFVSLASLAFGVTTLHDPSNDTAEVFSASEMAKAGVFLAPRIFSTGTIVYGAKAYDYYSEINNLKEALEHLGRLKKWGAFSVKSYNQPRREQRQQVIEAARQLKMMVVPEGGSLFQHNMTMVADGHTGVEHSIPVPYIYSDVVDFWSGGQTAYTPTLGVAYGGIWGENYWYDKTEVWKNERLLGFVPENRLTSRARRRVTAPEEDYNHFRAAGVAAKLNDAGVLVNLGAHGQREGLAAHWEMWMFVQGGMSEMQALRAGTINGARYLGLDGEVGSLAPGKLADLIVLDRDPLADIRNTESVSQVMLNGRLYEAATMNEIYPRHRPRGKFWWER